MQDRLKIGDRVFDYNVGYWGHIVALEDDGTHTRAGLSMDGYDLQENLAMFDCEIPEDEYDWEEEDIQSLYLEAPGIVGRDGNAVCHEHTETADGYPYYSPYLDENLFGFEVFTPAEYNSL